MNRKNTISVNSTITETPVFKIKDFWSAITHFIGMVLAVAGMPVLLIRSALNHASLLTMFGCTVFMLSMILLYAASTAYHSFHVSDQIDMILKKIDHAAIFVLIAGSYTPVCLTVLKSGGGYGLLLLIWTIAFCGIIFKLFWVTCPKWMSSVIYTLMGWLCVMFLSDILQAVSMTAFLWLFAGGIAYTTGAIIYALKPELFHGKRFGNHELFHCFVLLGSFLHYVFVFRYLTIMG